MSAYARGYLFGCITGGGVVFLVFVLIWGVLT